MCIQPWIPTPVLWGNADSKAPGGPKERPKHAVALHYSSVCLSTGLPKSPLTAPHFLSFTLLPQMGWPHTEVLWLSHLVLTAPPNPRDSVSPRWMDGWTDRQKVKPCSLETWDVRD